MKTQLSNGIFTIDHVLDQKTCKSIIDHCNQKGWNKSSPSGGGHGRTGKEDARTNEFCVFHDEQLAEKLWDEVNGHLDDNLAYLGDNVYFNQKKGCEWTPEFIYDKMRIYKYEPGDEFPEHIDYKMKRDSYKNSVKITDQSFLTLLVYLNDDFEGGETGYWPDHTGIHCRFLRDEEKQGKAKEHQVVIKPYVGQAVVQDQNILHEGLPTTKGTKYILRTDVIHRRKSTMDHRVNTKERVGEWERLFETSCKNYAD
jgi:hypothetical protein